MSVREGRLPIVASKKSRPARRGPLRRLILRLGLLASLLLGLALAFFRLQGVGPVTDTTRTLNKRLGNKAMMRLGPLARPAPATRARDPRPIISRIAEWARLPS
jgi:hypothetical protein